MPHIASARPQRLDQPLARRAVGPLRRPPARHHRCYRHERHRVERENPTGADGRHDETADGRSHRPGDIHVQPVQRRCLREQLTIDQIGLYRLPGRAGHRVAATQGKGESQDQGRRSGIEEGRDGQRRRGQEHRQLRAQQQPSPVDQVRQGPGGQGQQHDRQARSGLHQRRPAAGSGRSAATARRRSASRCPHWRRTARSTAPGKPGRNAAAPTPTRAGGPELTAASVLMLRSGRPAVLARHHKRLLTRCRYIMPMSPRAAQRARWAAVHPVVRSEVSTMKKATLATIVSTGLAALAPSGWPPCPRDIAVRHGG